MPLRVVVLAHNSLLAGGVASRLREDSHLFEVDVIDAAAVDDAANQLLSITPEIVIVDALDERVIEKLPIIKLLEILPTVKVIQLNCRNDQIRVFTSEQRRAHKTGELFTMMQDIVTS